MKLIDADALRREIQQITFHGNGGILTVMAINKAPVIDAEPVRHGKWIKTHPIGIYACSVCGREVMTKYIDDYSYCINCGAKMDARKKNDKAD